MGILEAIILGIVQGIAEFLPISSSAHLIIFRDMIGIGAGMDAHIALTFDIALHLGTLLAILIYFFKDFIEMIKKGLTKGAKDDNGKILWNLIIATIPAGIVGVIFGDTIEDAVRSNFIIIALALAIMGIIIYLADYYSKDKKTIKKMTLKDSFIIGCSQILALIPGFSRSGTTIAAGRMLGINREDSAKFSFYLSAPVVGGAVILELMKKSTWIAISANAPIFILGILISFGMGIVCIKYLLKYLHNHNFKIFMIYRLLLAALVILWVVF